MTEIQKSSIFLRLWLDTKIYLLAISKMKFFSKACISLLVTPKRIDDAVEESWKLDTCDSQAFISFQKFCTTLHEINKWTILSVWVMYLLLRDRWVSTHPECHSKEGCIYFWGISGTLLTLSATAKGMYLLLRDRWVSTHPQCHSKGDVFIVEG